jgi:ABC-type Fe3+/spermidine/putrescine transport system ATPase subunit
VLLRPEDVQLARDGETSPNVVRATVRSAAFLGSVYDCTLDVSGSLSLRAVFARELAPAPGQQLCLALPPQRCTMLEEADTP